MQILKHWRVISTLCLGHPFYWRPGIKTSSTSEEGSVSGNNWGNIARLRERATLLHEGPESHFIFLPITFSFFVFFFFLLSLNQSDVELVLWDSGIEMEHVWQKEECGEEKHRERWVGLMWPRELPERKMGKREGRGHWWEWASARIRRKWSENDIYVRDVCVCVCAYVTVWLSPSHPTKHAPPSSLHSSPIHFHPDLCSFSPSLPPWLFTLTVIWQAWGWQTWRRQGKRLSGLALLGSCWLAEELAVSSGSCNWPGDWWGSEEELSLRWCDGVG